MFVVKPRIVGLSIVNLIIVELTIFEQITVGGVHNCSDSDQSVALVAEIGSEQVDATFFWRGGNPRL